VIWELLLVFAAYLAGSVPSALLVVLGVTGKDVRDTGSGNVGATNATRAGGLGVGVLVTVLDIAKGVVPVWVMAVFNPASGWLAAALVAVVVGHCFPVWLRFRGGKGVATAFGGFLVLAPKPALLAALIWLIVLLVWRWVSLASVAAAAAFPILTFSLARPAPAIQGAVIAAALLIILRHHSNLRQLAAGKEPKIGGPGGGGR
jgi:glycerol-3-phosphate acyltransferase PlsY